MTDTYDNGWGFTGQSRKAHFFRAGKSLCGRYGFRSPKAPLEPEGAPSKDDCVGCRRILDREKATV